MPTLDTVPRPFGAWHIYFSNCLKTQIMETHNKLHEFFIDQLQDMYWAEQKLVKSLPKLEEAAWSDELKQAFNSHLQETKNHVSRIEKIFDLINMPAQSKKCHAIAGI